jgi:hypothetical protein
VIRHDTLDHSPGDQVALALSVRGGTLPFSDRQVRRRDQESSSRPTIQIRSPVAINVRDRAGSAAGARLIREAKAMRAPASQFVTVYEVNDRRASLPYGARVDAATRAGRHAWAMAAVARVRKQKRKKEKRHTTPGCSSRLQWPNDV